MRQWKERYQTGQMPGVQSRTLGSGSTGQFARRTSGPLSGRSGQLAPDWGNESPASSLPPTANRRSGLLTPPAGGPPPMRRSGSLSSPLAGRNDDPASPPTRTSGLLGNPARNANPEAGNRSDSWKWQNRPGTTSGTLTPPAPTSRPYGQSYEENDGYSDSYQEPARQPSGRMLPVPYQGGRRTWDQGGFDDYEQGNSSNLPATLDTSGRSSAYAAIPEEELARRLPPGRKPPAFIPATRQRRPYRLSNYRIISGTVSIILVVVALIGGLSFLAVHYGPFHNLFGSKPLAPYKYDFPQPTPPPLSGTPQATPGNASATKFIVMVTTAKNYTSNFDPVNLTTTFKVGDTVNVLWQVRNAQVNDTISIKWYQDGSQITDLDQKNTQQTFTKAISYNGVFGLAYPNASVGTAELYYNGQLAWTIQFIITN